MSVKYVVLDHCLSPRLASALGAMYSHHGFRFLHLKEISDAPTEDVIWADKYKQFGGKFVLSGDTRIAYLPHQHIAFIDNGLISVFPSENWCKIKIHQHAATILHYWPTIEKLFSSANDGTCWRLPVTRRSGVLSLPDVSLEPLEIPAHVLEKARASRKSNSAL